MDRLVVYALALSLLCAACVTINVYFPEAAAERAADQIVREVYGQPAAESSRNEDEPSSGSSSGDGGGRMLMLLVTRALDVIVPAAHAQNVNIDIESPAINALVGSMKARHERLVPHYASGAIGLTADAMVAIRDRNLIPLAERNTVRQLVAEENADRGRLYREIAKENGRPEWEQRIRDTFAERWVSRARTGWHYQTDSGDWRQK